MSGLNWVISGVIAAAVLASGGCGTPGEAPLGSGCLPPSFSISPAATDAGGSISVSAKDATCDPRYGANAQIQLEITDGSGAKVLDTLAPMNDAGGFSAVLTVPDSAVPGLGTVTAYPYNLDWCDDTGRNNRVGASGGKEAPEIRRASCVMPSQPLTIEPGLKP